MNSMADEHPEALLAAYSVDGLAPAERRMVDDHLAGCAACRAQLRSLQTTALLLRNLSEPALPRSFLLPPSTAPRRAAPRPLLPISFLSAAAVLFLALGLSLTLSRPVPGGASLAASQAGSPTSMAATGSGRAFAAATTADATSAARAALAPAPQPAAAHAQQAASTTSAAAASLFAVQTHPATSTPAPPTPIVSKLPAPPVSSAPPGIRPYQVLLGAGGTICLLVAAMWIIRNRSLARV